MLFEFHRIKEKILALKEDWDNLSICEREQSLNKIDQQSTELLLHAEKKCYKLRIGVVEFSL